jgi:wobble nucleotide-excising tRNase
MIEKFVQIKNVGKFGNYSASGDVTFRKVNLIYGENAQGKTTITSILRSLQTDDPNLILARQRLGSTEQPFVQIRLTNQNAIFNNGSWDHSYPDIEVFDSKFVDSNVFSGDKIDITHKRNLLEFVISAESVALARELSQCDKDIDTLNTQIRENKTALEQHIEGKIELSDFVDLEVVENIDALINNVQKELDSCIEVEPIQIKSLLDVVGYNVSPLDDLAGIVSSSISDVSQGAISTLNEHIKKHLDENGESWLKQGVKYLLDEICPFCGQRLEDKSLVETYSKYFSEEYQNLVDKIEDCLAQTKRIMSDGELLKLQVVIQKNEKLIEFWRKYVVSDLEPMFDSTSLKESVISLRETILPILQKKLSRPLESLTLDESINEKIQDVKSEIEKLDQYHESVKSYNNLITARKNEVVGLDKDKATEKLRTLINSKIRYSEKVKNLADDYQSLLISKKDTEVKKREFRAELETKLSSVLSELQEEINRILSNCCADFKIIELDKSYIGRIANVEYAIEILGEQVPVDDKGLTSPCFKNTLSAGDRTTLAFAFYIAKIRKDANLSNKTLVIDDPISSLDDFRSLQTANEITAIIDDVSQIIVMSHHQEFLQKLYKLNAAHQVKCLRIVRTGVCSEIVELIPEETFCGGYIADYRVLKGYLENGTRGRLESIARCIRPVLEGNLKVRFPDSFTNNEWLGDYIGKIRNAEGSDVLFGIRPKLTELTQVNEYSKQFHHDTNPDGWKSVTTSDVELTSFARRTLDIIPGV